MPLFINGVGQDTFNMNGVSIDNLYVDGVLVWSSIQEVAGIPRYELTEALVDVSTVDDSANTASDYNGLLTESDGTTPYEPTALQYPRNGLLELANGRILDTQLTVDPETDSYGIYGIYDADGSTEYKIWAVYMVGSSLYNLYEGDQDTPLAYTGGYTFDPIVGTWKITEGRPSFLPPLVTGPTPIADYAFEDNMVDSTGNYIATDPLGTITYTDGSVGRCAVFDGASGIKHNVAITMPKSVSIWIKPSSTAVGYLLYFTDKTAIIMDQQRVCASSYIPSADRYQVSNATHPVGTWVHAVALFTDDQTRPVLYINGALQTDEVHNDYWNPPVDTNTLGYGDYAPARWFNGEADELEVFDYLLTQEEVTVLFEKGTP